MTNSPQSPPRGSSKGKGWLLALMLVCGIVAAAIFSNTSKSRPSGSNGGSLASSPPAAQLPAGTIALHEGTLARWDQAKRPGQTTYLVGGLQLELSSKDVDGSPAPVLRVRDRKGGILEETGEIGGDIARAEIAAGRIDDAAEGAQVIFSTFSGGAHCCQSVKVLEKLNGVWKTVEIAQLDGDSIGTFPTDIDDDGKPEFKLSDGRFLYAFASYAESWAPPKVVSVEDGIVRDQSAKPSYRPVYEPFADRAQADCEANHNNGACAAFAAAAARLGKLDWAWPKVLAAYNRQSDWVYPTACRSPAPTVCSKEDTVVFDTFPESLHWFLGDTGYTTATYVAPSNAAEPSFSCENIAGEVLKLICASPLLAKADRQAATLYEHSIALSSDPASTRQAQQQFLTLRDGAPPDALILLRIYQARIATLSSAQQS